MISQPRRSRFVKCEGCNGKGGWYTDTGFVVCSGPDGCGGDGLKRVKAETDEKPEKEKPSV